MLKLHKDYDLKEQTTNGIANIELYCSRYSELPTDFSIGSSASWTEFTSTGKGILHIYKLCLNSSNEPEWVEL